MPVYQYRCTSGDNVFTITRRLSEREELALCRDDDGRGVAQALGPFAQLATVGVVREGKSRQICPLGGPAAVVATMRR